MYVYYYIGNYVQCIATVEIIALQSKKQTEYNAIYTKNVSPPLIENRISDRHASRTE